MAKILLIEDDPILLQMYQDKLSLAGFEVITASGGQDGLNKAQTVAPQLVLLDVMIPQKNGFEVLDELKKNPQTKPIPVIILTNLIHERDAEDAIERGAVKYITKSSIEPEQLVQTINEVLTPH